MELMRILIHVFVPNLEKNGEHFDRYRPIYRQFLLNMLFCVNSGAHTTNTMPEVFHPSADHHLAQNSTDIAPAESDIPVRSQMDEFVLGFRDCANESLRYLEATSATASDREEAESTGRGLVDALRTHLVEHEAETMRHRRRRRSDDDDELGRSAASRDCGEDRLSLQQPPRRRRRLRLTPASLHPRRLNNNYSTALCYPEEIQTAQLRSRYHSRNVSDTINTSDGDSGCDRSLTADTSSDLVIDDDAAAEADDGFGQENMDELREYARQLSTLADHNVRVRRLLTELFQLMDSDDD